MVYLQINKKNHASGKHNLIDRLNKHLTHRDDKIFILFYMEGCGPCNATRPEWSKLKNVLSKNFLNKNDIVIVSIDHELAGKLNNIGNEPNSFPTIRYITHAGEINENYEDSDISKKDRTIDSFVEWIEHKSGEKNITQYVNHHPHKRTHKKRINIKFSKFRRTRKHKGGKWSLKYKRSINCNRPKGFSQKQHCRYGRK
jgi:hypothetical protein